MALPEGLGSWSLARAELLDSLVRPDDFFARDGSERLLSSDGFVLVAFVVLVVAAIGIGFTAIAVLFPDALTPDAVARLLPKLFILVILAGIAVLLVWMLWGVLLHVASRIAGGSGTFSDALAVAAYGLGPVVVGGVFLLALAVGYTLTPLAPDFPTIEAYRDFLDRTEAGVGPYLDLLTVLWQWYVWTFGLKHSRNLSTSRAGLAAGVVALATLLWSVV